MANDLAHRIDNPLQAITNLVYLASRGDRGEDARYLALELSGHIERLSQLVSRLLALPTAS